MSEEPINVEEWLSPVERQFGSERGLDLERIARVRRESAADPEYVVFARRKVMPPPWKILETRVDGGTYTDGTLRVICSVAKELDGKHWLHVSLSTLGRMPTYDELHKVKTLFIGPSRKAIMVLPRREEHVNFFPFALHLFCCLEEDVLPDFTRGLGCL